MRLLPPLVNAARRAYAFLAALPAQVKLALAVTALLAAGWAHYSRLQDRLADAEAQAAVGRGNMAALRDSTRVLGATKDSLTVVIARAAVLEQVTKRQRDSLDRTVPGLKAELRRKDAEVVGLVQRTIALDSINRVLRAGVTTDTAGVRHVAVTDTFPGGTLALQGAVGPREATFDVRLRLDPCRLTDIVAANGSRTSVQLITTSTGGICQPPVHDGPPVFEPPRAPSTTRPAWWKDRRVWGTALVTTTALSLLHAAVAQ